MSLLVRVLGIGRLFFLAVKFNVRGMYREALEITLEVMSKKGSINTKHRYHCINCIFIFQLYCILP